MTAVLLITMTIAWALYWVVFVLGVLVFIREAFSLILTGDFSGELTKTRLWRMFIKALKLWLLSAGLVIVCIFLPALISSN